MSLDEAIQRLKKILPEHLDEFQKVLEKLPNGIEQWLYSPKIKDLINLYQGDIVRDIATCYINKDGKTVYGSDTVALISNSCDMVPGRRDFIIVSPIISVENYIENAKKLKINPDDTIYQVRKNQILRYFYLPPKGNLEESFIDFSRMVTISSSYLNNIKNENPENFIVSLSSHGHYFFLLKLNYHLSRTEDITE